MAAAAAAVASGMSIGANMGGLNYYSSYYPFANIMRSLGEWEKHSGTATFTQYQGALTITSGTGVFKARINTRDGLPAGTYQVRNPNACSIGFSVSFDGTTGLTGGFLTTTAFTFVYDGTSDLHMSANGAVSGVEVWVPGADEVDEFNADWIDFQAVLQPRVLRMMDWNATNTNIDVDWADRTSTAGMSFYGLGGLTVPYELQIEAANRLNADLWICVPTRSSSAYWASLAALVAANLEPALNVYVEYTNEAWNTSGGFKSTTSWVETYNHTRIQATINAGTGVITKTGHGRTTGNPLRFWSTEQWRSVYFTDGGLTSNAYYVGRGETVYAQVIDANTFTVSTDAGGTVPIVWPSLVTDVQYIVEGEVGKTVDLNTHYATTALSIWTAFDTALGSSRVNAVMGSQAASTGRTTARLAVTGVAARAPKVAVAPYFTPLWLGAAVDIASGQFTPKAWSNAGSVNLDLTMTVHFGVYASGSTPTTAEVVAGTGTGLVAGGHVSFANSYVASTYDAGSAVTGLANGTSYKVYFVFVDSEGFHHVLSDTIAASASASTTTLTDSNANQKTRTLYALDHPTDGPFVRLAAQQTAIAASASTSSALVCYEGGQHLDETAPTAIQTWFESFLETTEFADSYKQYLNGMATNDLNIEEFTVYQDCSGLSLSWTLADTMLDLTDARLVAVGSYAGNVPRLTLVDSGTVTGTDQLTSPSLPASIATLPGSGWTYSILKGNEGNNYDISSGVLRMVSTTGIDFGTPVEQTVTILATDGSTPAVFDVGFFTGTGSYYEADDLFAFSTINDTDTVAANPDVGSALTKASGTDATASGGLWVNTTGRYNNNLATTAVADLTTGDFMIACVANIGTVAADSLIAYQIGTPSFVRLRSTSTWTNMHWHHSNNVVNTTVITGPLSATTRVYWLHYTRADGKYRYGYNQTYMNPSGASGDTPSVAFPTSLSRYIDTQSSAFQRGSIRVRNADGISTLAFAQTLMDHHGL